MKLVLVVLAASAILLGNTGVALAKDLTTENWRIYNVKPSTASYWDINQVAEVAGGGLEFPIQQFEGGSTGSFAVYLLNNYNFDITAQTLKATVAWTAGTYKTRSTECAGAYVRFEFQDTTSGAYDSNDYWWSTVSLDLDAQDAGTLEANLGDRSLWTNQSGRSANDTTPDWLQWQGDIVHTSPYDGFTKATKNVKQLGLSFGSSCRYASGVARVEAPGLFTVTSFTIAP